MRTAAPPRKARVPGLGLNARELSGAFADIGVLLPVAMALIARNGMNGTSVFLCAGLMYIACGLYYRVPAPVQPLKVAAAVAIAEGLGPHVLHAAGILMGLVLLLVAATGLARRLNRAFTPPVVRGIQLGVGLLMIRGGLDMITGDSGWTGMPVPGWVPAAVPLAVASGTLLWLLIDNRRLPASLVVLGAGVLLALATGKATWPAVPPGGAPLAHALPAGGDFVTAFGLLVLPQLPLTLGNAVVGASDTARDHYGKAAARVTPEALCGSLGVGNLIAGALGGMPMCHGAGGMTAHHRLGARTAGAPLLIGTALVLLALLWGNSVVALAALIPPHVLGVLLIYVGVEHAMLVRHVAHSPNGVLVALTIGAVAVLANMLTAVCAGWAMAIVAPSLTAARVAIRPGRFLPMFGIRKRKGARRNRLTP